jgi:hypothetical protein
MNHTRPTVSAAAADAEYTTTSTTPSFIRDVPVDDECDRVKRFRPVPNAASSSASIEDPSSPPAGLPSKEAVVGYGLEDSIEVSSFSGVLSICVGLLA